MHECIKRQREIQSVWRGQESLVCDQDAINRLQYVDNNWAKSINFGFDHVKEGFIVELVVECNDLVYSLETNFAFNPRSRLL